MNKSGFTLIEVLIYVAILGAVVAAFIGFSISISSAKSKAYVAQEVQANARVALNLITQKILSANGINVGVSTFDVDPGGLSLAMANSNKNPTIISLNADNGQLQIREGIGEPLNITSDEVRITNLIFTYLNAGGEKESVKVELTAEYKVTNDVIYQYTYSLQTAVTLRQ